ncbi:MAG: hypothetical protein R3C25_07715 [Hyphomonadaceae bacterium]
MIASEGMSRAHERARIVRAIRLTETALVWMTTEKPRMELLDLYLDTLRMLYEMLEDKPASRAPLNGRRTPRHRGA